MATGVEELDRVLGGGLVPGSVTVIGGAPGMGKSTLLLQAAAAVAASGRTALYASSEESRVQVRARAERLGALTDRLWLHAEASVDDLVGALDSVRPDLVVVDSVQTAFDPETGSAPGSLNQVRAVAQRLVVEARARGCAVVLVGQVTKDGHLAGPKALEHIVDTVLAFEGDKHHALRLLRAVKHRYGATDDLGVLEMTERRPGRGAGSQRPLPGRPAAGRARLGGRAHPRRPPADPGRGAGPRAPRSATCRPAGRPRASTAAGWPCCWPCWRPGCRSARPSPRSTPSPPAGSAWSSPPATSASPWR